MKEHILLLTKHYGVSNEIENQVIYTGDIEDLRQVLINHVEDDMYFGYEVTPDYYDNYIEVFDYTEDVKKIYEIIPVYSHRSAVLISNAVDYIEELAGKGREYALESLGLTEEEYSDIIKIIYKEEH